ncbi:hypothetical protein BDN67DRAFT_950901 [Paxillus ammoniavirescens]|nr:hypothetical protein BDN67DRAFT_950901 [Paxillus ammoniavirescens]
MDRDDGNAITNADVRTQQQQQRSSIPSTLFIIFMLFMFTNHSGDEFLARNHYQDTLQSMNYQLSNFTAWMSGETSNFTMPDRTPAITPLAQSFMNFGTRLDPHHASYFPNTTGFIRGDLDFYNITPSSLNLTSFPWKPYAESYMSDANMTELLSNLGSWNWSAVDKISWSVIDRAPINADGVSERIAMIHGRIDLTDPARTDDMRLEFEGVHFLPNGSVYGFAEPNGRPIDIRYLPVIVPDSAQNETARAIKPELLSRINKVKERIDAGIIDQESPEGSDIQTGCGFLVYAQIEPSGISEDVMRDLEDELQKPTGKWTVDRPPLHMTGVLMSRECGLLYRLRDAEGLRSQSFFRKVTSYAGVSAIFYLILLALLCRQTDRMHSPAGLSRVSLWTFLAQAIVDAVAFAGHITFAILANGRPSMSLVAPAFLACILFALEAQHAILINQVQAPEDAVSSTAQPPQSPPLNGTIATADAPQPQLPLPTIAPPRPTVPSFVGLVIRHLLSDPQARIWLGMFIFFTFIIRVIVSPSLTLFFVASMYSMFWLPQIIRSVKRGRSSSLSAEYLVGTSICRLYFALYFLRCPKNVLDVEPRRWAYYLCAFVLLQVVVVLLQQRLGPAFFLPKRFATTQTYNYHPPLPLSVSDPESPDQSLGDCSICMEPIHADDPRHLQQVASGLLQKVGGRKNYSMAPCHHLFHTDCLEKWLAIKNICPQCRRPLPPL